MLEALEERTNPATFQYDGTNLTVLFGNTSAALITATETAPDEITIVEGANSTGPFNVTGNLTLNVGNTLTGVVVGVNMGGNTFAGNVNVTTGSSPAGFGSAVLVDNGTISGGLNVTTGSGDDSIGLGTGFSGLAPLTVQGTVNINTNGSSTPPGGDTVIFGAGGFGAHLAGNATVSNANSFTLDATATVGGSLTANSGSKSGNFNFSLLAGSSVAGNAYLTTGNNAATAGTDSVVLNGTITGLALVNQNGGTNDFSFAGTIGTNLTYQGGTGIDSGVIGGTILGNLSVIQGNGTNTLSFNSASTVLGNSISITGGTGADSVQFNGLVAPGARLNANLGNGNDTVQLLLVPQLASAYIDGGYGVNTFIQAPGSGTITYPFTKRNF